MRYRKWGNLAKSLVRILLGVPLSLEVRNTFPPGKGRAPVTWGFYDPFQWERVGEGQSNLPACSIFSNSFSLNYSICQVAIFGVSLS